MRTYDPARDEAEHYAAGMKWQESRPVCSFCGYNITEDYCYKIRGWTICQRCIDDCRESIEEE